VQTLEAPGCQKEFGRSKHVKIVRASISPWRCNTEGLVKSGFCQARARLDCASQGFAMLALGWVAEVRCARLTLVRVGQVRVLPDSLHLGSTSQVCQARTRQCCTSHGFARDELGVAKLALGWAAHFRVARLALGCSGVCKARTQFSSASAMFQD